MTGHVIHLNTAIQASQETVWDVLTDLEHAGEILHSVKTSSKSSEGEYDVGTTWHETRDMFGHHGDEEIHVAECDAPRRTLWETKLGHDKVRMSFALQPLPGGITKLLLTATLDQKERTALESAMWNIWGGFSFHSTRKMFEHDLEDIKAEAERRAGV